MKMSSSGQVENHVKTERPMGVLECHLHELGDNGNLREFSARLIYVLERIRGAYPQETKLEDTKKALPFLLAKAEIALNERHHLNNQLHDLLMELEQLVGRD